MQTVSKKNVQLAIEELEKQNESFIAPDNIDRTNLGRDKADIKLYGTTIVNLLGKYGNFEDGAPNIGGFVGNGYGRTTEKAFTGSYSWKGVVHTISGGAAFTISNIPFNTHVFFFRTAIYPKYSTSTRFRIYNFTKSEGSNNTPIVYPTPDTWNQLTGKIDITSFTGWDFDNDDIELLIYHSTGTDYQLDDPIYLDNIAVYDLTARGDLDPVRATYYTAKYGQTTTKWEELEEDDLAIELPYVDGVACIGWDWSSGDKAITIENRGKNLFDGALESGDIDSNGANIVDATKIRSANYIPVKPDAMYILSNDKGYTDVTAYYYDVNKIFLSSASVGTSNFTIPAGVKYMRFVMVGTDVDAKVQLEEGDTPTNHEPVKTDKIEIPAGTHLFGYAGVQDSINLSTGKKDKRWEKESDVVVTSGSGTLTKSGTGTAILIDENGVPYEGTVSGTTLTTSAPDGTYTVWYQLATPKVLEIPVTSNFNYLGRGHNQILLSQHKKDTFVADGVTKTFNLSSTASSTSYTVKIAGQIISGVTKTTSSITFSVPPRRNEIIEVIYNVDYSLSPGIEAEVLKTNGTTMDVKFLTDISITEQEEALDVNPKNGPRKHAVRNRGYELSISKDLIEAQNNLEYFRDKTFRVKIYNSRDGTTEYLSPCTYKQGLSKDWISGSESVVILAGDYYDNA